ncbi:MAG: hypothetical protein A49_15260 [Methyloceanibacter sp.]|nr:MAG: hypothetical protein A49_15260 [Methyloceanibacter sp.]
MVPGSGTPPVTLYHSAWATGTTSPARGLLLHEDQAQRGRGSPICRSNTTRARWYDPDLGRWLQRDPRGLVDGVNLYQYVSSWPARLVDPSGFEGEEAPGANTINWKKPEKVQDCVVHIRIGHNEDITPLEGGNSGCSAFGNLTCNGNDVNYTPCKNPRTGEMELCPNPGLIPNFPSLPGLTGEDVNGPGQGTFWSIKYPKAFKEANDHARWLAKNCQCNCKAIWVKVSCDFRPAQSDLDHPKYQQACGRQTQDIGPKGELVHNVPPWTGGKWPNYCSREKNPKLGPGYDDPR